MLDHKTLFGLTAVLHFTHKIFSNYRQGIVTESELSCMSCLKVYFCTWFCKGKYSKWGIM